MVDLSLLHSNQRILLQELLNRGVTLEMVDLPQEIVKAQYKDHIEYLYDRDSSIVPYSMSVIAGNKRLVKRIMYDNGISVPIGEGFKLSNREGLITAFSIINASVTVKPVFGSHGQDVHLNIKSKQQLLDTLAHLEKNYKLSTEILIEEYFPAKEYRIFITKNGDYAVLEREPASVVGNGIDTIHQLILAENYKRTHPREKSWCEIHIDTEMERYLEEQGLSMNYVPSQLEKVFVRPNSNVAMGGLPIDRTDEAHPTAIELAKKTLNAFPGLPYIGIDFMTKDITKPQTPESYRIIEVNTIPGVDMHFRPAIGKSRNIAVYMADLIFPETV